MKDGAIGLMALSGAWLGAGFLAGNGHPGMDVPIVQVSALLTDGLTPRAAIQAAVRKAAAMGGGVVDFGGETYKIDESIVISHAGVALANGAIVSSGHFPALIVAAPDVTCRNMTFSRSRYAGPLDSSRLRSCVVVEAARFHSLDCNYTETNQACLYLAHGVCDGAIIRGGRMTGTSRRQDACGVYAAPGNVGNRNITVKGVRIHDSTQGVLLFDTSDSLIGDNVVERLRVLPTISLSAWTHVRGDVWRQRTAPGEPGADGPLTDRADGNTRVISVDGNMLGEVELGLSSPGINRAGIKGGYVYLNLGGIDPNSRSISSGILSGYAYTIYATGVNEHLCARNRIIGNVAQDVDGFGIYLQLGNHAGGRGNQAIDNVLRNVCLQGSQHASLAFGGIGVGGGNHTTILRNTIEGVGSPGRDVPGVHVIPGVDNTSPGGQLIATTVKGGASQGFQISSSNWKITRCNSLYNADSGFVVWANTPGARVDNVEFIDCISEGNGGEGFSIAGITPSIDYLSVKLKGGRASLNARRGVLVDGSDSPTVKDCSITRLALWDNGDAEHPQITVRKSCIRTVIEGCSIRSSTNGAVGLQVEGGAVDTIVGPNVYQLTTPEVLQVPVVTSQ